MTTLNSARPIVNQRGQSLIMMAFASMMTTQQKEASALTQKLAAVDFTRVMTSTLANATQCSDIFAASNLVDPAAMPFDASSVSAANPYIFTVKSIPSAAVSTGGLVSPLSNILSLNSSTSNPPGIEVRVTSPTTATVNLNFDSTQLVRPLKNLSFSNVNLTTSGPVTATSITGCSAGFTLNAAAWAHVTPPGTIDNGQGFSNVSCGVSGLNYVCTLSFSTPMPDDKYIISISPEMVMAGYGSFAISLAKTTTTISIATWQNISAPGQIPFNIIVYLP